MDLQLTEQVVFIAGSTRGIGRSIAETLLEEGARVVVTGRSEPEVEAASRELTARFGAECVLGVAGDLRDDAEIARAYAATVDRFGRIDHLIANLGTGAGEAGWNPPACDWERLFAMNVFASTRLAQQAIPFFQANKKKGSILFVSSIVAVEATPAPLPYSAAKAALNNYAKNLARQLGPEGIRVNTIAPGNIFFPGGSWGRHLSERRQAVEQMLQTEVPLRRFGTPEEIAAFAAFLCSQRAGFATGACFVVDGGQTRTV